MHRPMNHPSQTVPKKKPPARAPFVPHWMRMRDREEERAKRAPKPETGKPDSPLEPKITLPTEETETADGEDGKKHIEW